MVAGDVVSGAVAVVAMEEDVSGSGPISRVSRRCVVAPVAAVLRREVVRRDAAGCARR